MYKCAPSRELPRTGCAVARHTKEREARREKRGRGTGRRTRHSTGKAEQDGERGTAGGTKPSGDKHRAAEGRARGANKAAGRNQKKDSGRSCRPLCLVRSCVPLSRCCALFGVAFRAPAFPAAPPVPWCIRFSECATGAGKLSA